MIARLLDDPVGEVVREQVGERDGDEGVNESASHLAGGRPGVAVARGDEEPERDRWFVAAPKDVGAHPSGRRPLLRPARP